MFDIPLSFRVAGITRWQWWFTILEIVIFKLIKRGEIELLLMQEMETLFTNKNATQIINMIFFFREKKRNCSKEELAY